MRSERSRFTKFNMFSKYFVVLFVFTTVSFVSTQYLGDVCVHIRQGVNGVCSTLANCPSAVEDLKKNVFPQICSFDITSPIVCCVPNAPAATPKPTSPSPTATPSPTPKPTQTSYVSEKNPTTTRVGQKSAQKCKEYGKYVYTTYVAPTLALGRDVNKSRDDCGIKHVKLIVGGVPATAREFPHQARIGYNFQNIEGGERFYACGGSLISENFVLTAGHCLISKEHGPASYARVGDLVFNTDSDDAQPQEVKVIERIKYPEYRPPSQYHDIGLLKLEKNVKLSAYAHPACLHVDKFIDTQAAIASGWGDTEYLGTASDELMKVTLDFFTYSDCKNAYEINVRRLSKGIVDETQVCAGSKTEKKDTCQGDSGGPLQIFNADVYCMYSVVGVTSFGKACGIANTAAVYTRVSYYIDWIEKTVWP